MARTPAAPRKRPKAAPRPKPRLNTLGPDAVGVQQPRGGYVHAGQAAAAAQRLPTNEQIQTMDLSGEYPPGETPEAVMYGRRMVVLALMVQGEPVFNIVAVCRQQYRMSETQTRYIVADIRQRWRADMDEMVVSARAEAVMRLRRDLSTMRTMATKDRDWAAIQRHEALLSKIEGTQAPVKVTVWDVDETMREAAAGILGTMTADEIQAYVTEGYEAATAARALPSP